MPWHSIVDKSLRLYCSPLRSSRFYKTRSLLLSCHPHQVRNSTSKSTQLRTVSCLPSWEVSVFESAYRQNLPARLPRSTEHLPAACSKWFIYDHGQDPFVIRESNVQTPAELRSSFWSEHDSVPVPLEVTTTKRTSQGDAEEFERIEAPLKLLLAHLSTPNPSSTHKDLSIYLAQYDLSSLPRLLQADIPTPHLLHPSPSASIKGDIYASSLWLGLSPTYTPLHRDPNPNFFVQLAGRKTIRLLPPEVGDALYHDLVTKLSSSASHISGFSNKIRGEEMMAGPQKKALHDAVWLDDGVYADLIREYGVETTLEAGEALFTPKGWWHSVKGIGEGVTASANWWFR